MKKAPPNPRKNLSTLYRVEWHTPADRMCTGVRRLLGEEAFLGKLPPEKAPYIVGQGPHEPTPAGVLSVGVLHPTQ